MILKLLYGVFIIAFKSFRKWEGYSQRLLDYEVVCLATMNRPLRRTLVRSVILIVKVKNSLTVFKLR